MKKLIFKKENGVVSVINVDMDAIRNLPEDIHLCWNCGKGYATKCPKMAHGEKKHIADYEYITDGYQVYENGVSDQLIVSGCSSFIPSVNPRTRAENEILRASLMEGIKAERFDVETPEEANMVQKYQVEHGLLQKYDSKRK